jgi:broad specificity phosphatase PhoE
MGDWPLMPESWTDADQRFRAVTLDLVELAAGRNLLLISHAQVGDSFLLLLSFICLC